VEHLDTLPHGHADALWAPDNLLTISEGNYGFSVVEQRSPVDHAFWSEVELEGEPLRILAWSGGYLAITQLLGEPAFHDYLPTLDVDGDGVVNPEDVFPTDPAASADTDGDGAPDAWNPGYGPEDSTLGLILDAFPNDFACQLEEHGIGGVCDFALVLPSDPGEPICGAGDVSPIPPTGVLAIPEASDLVPLCDGWVLYGDLENEQLVAQNVFSGRIALVVPLGVRSDDLELDTDAKRLFAASEYDSVVVEVDLLTGTTSSVAVPERPVSLAVGSVGDLFIAAAEDGGTPSSVVVYRLPDGGSALEGGWSVPGSRIVYQRGRDELFTARFHSTVHVPVSRYAFDPATGLTLIERYEGSDIGKSLALSPDGDHLAFGLFHYGSDTITHFLTNDLLNPPGAWNGRVCPRGLAFDPTSTLLAATTDDHLQIFDVDSHALVGELPLPECGYVEPEQAAFSMGGAMAFAMEECSSGSEIRWLRID